MTHESRQTVQSLRGPERVYPGVPAACHSALALRGQYNAAHNARRAVLRERGDREGEIDSWLPSFAELVKTVRNKLNLTN